MNAYTIEVYMHDDVMTMMTFKGLLGYSWEMRAHSRWCFYRGGKSFVVLGMTKAIDREMSSVAVDRFLRPSTDVEQVDLRRLEFVRPSKAAKK